MKYYDADVFGSGGQSDPPQAKRCPITHQHCHDPLCEGEICLRDFQKERDRYEYDRLITIVSKQAASIERLTRGGERHPQPTNKPLLVLLTLINKTQYIMADIKLTLGATPKDGTFALIDTVTGGVITSAVFSAQTVGANSNPAAATFVIDPADTTGNSVLPTPLAAGSGTIGFGATASYTDSTGAAQTNVAFTIVKNFTVVLGADGVTLDIIFPA
jgi:hypothetical protein